MKRTLLLTVLAAVGLTAFCQNKNTKSAPSSAVNTLLWRISGKNLTKPSYLFGTMHMICANDIEISDSLKNAIKRSDKIYLELDMDNMQDMAMQMLMNPRALLMRGDTTLSDLLTEDEYKKVKAYFEKGENKMLPFSVLEKLKPMFLQSMMMDQSGDCKNMIVMEKLVMDEAGRNNKDIDGLETLEFQLGIFDKIPYKTQAQWLVKAAEGGTGDGEMEKLTNAYRNQELSKMEDLTGEDESMEGFANLLLYDRNANWANKLPQLMAEKSLVIAVGAGHLPGEKGVINLLRNAGYKVEPVKNEMIKK